MKPSISNVFIDAHPLEEAVVVRYNSEGTDYEASQQVINLKDLSESVDISALAGVIISKCPIIPSTLRVELEQTLFYLQKRQKSSRSQSRVGSASSHDASVDQTSSVRADLDDVESYIELFYEDISEKKKGALCVLELTNHPSNLAPLIENETLIGALSRVFREDWKTNFDLATTIARIFVKFSHYAQFQMALSHHKVGALCLNIVEYELKRGEAWAAEAAKGDERTAKKCRLAIRKQHTLLTACITVLTNLAVDMNTELKMVRRDVLPLLIKCLQTTDSTELLLGTVELMLKLSIFDENKALLVHPTVIDRLLNLFPISDVCLRKAVLRLLFNLSFDSKARSRMVDGGLVVHVAPLIQNDSKAMNLLYQLSINDKAKAIIPITETIQLLMRDLLSGTGSDVTKAVLLNACIEKRNAQLVVGTEGQGLDLLMESALDNRDLLVAKVVRCIAAHEGPTQDMFVKWLPRLLSIGMTEAVEAAEERASLGLESMGIAALIRAADWIGLCTSHKLVPWMGDQLQSTLKEKEPLQLQIVIMCGTMARQLEAARALIPLLEVFLQLLHTRQIDDEFVVQLLYLFLQLLRHKELSDRLMGPESKLGPYVIDLMHDKNAAIREMCDNALHIIGEHSQDWARRIAAERFRFHNEQWLIMVEADGGGLMMGGDDMQQLEDDYGGDVLFDDQYDDDGFELGTEERLF